MRYNSATLPPSAAVVATLEGASPITLTAEGVATHLARSFEADRVDIIMMTLDAARTVDVIRKGQRITFTVQE